MASVGRPNFPWSPELIAEIEDRILAGQSIDAIVRTEGFPSDATFWRKYASDPEFEAIITRAMEVRTERDMAGLIELADTANAETHNAIKLKVWTRMWVAGKRKPRKYGERIAQDVNVSGAIQILSTIPRPAQLEDGKTIDAEITDIES